MDRAIQRATEQRSSSSSIDRSTRRTSAFQAGGRATAKPASDQTTGQRRLDRSTHWRSGQVVLQRVRDGESIERRQQFGGRACEQASLECASERVLVERSTHGATKRGSSFERANERPVIIRAIKWLRIGQRSSDRALAERPNLGRGSEWPTIVRASDRTRIARGGFRPSIDRASERSSFDRRLERVAELLSSQRANIDRGTELASDHGLTQCLCCVRVSEPRSVDEKWFG